MRTKHYTDKVADGLNVIVSSMETMLDDYRDDVKSGARNKEDVENLAAALEWIKYQERKAIARKLK